MFALFQILVCHYQLLVAKDVQKALYPEQYLFNIKQLNSRNSAPEMSSQAALSNEQRDVVMNRGRCLNASFCLRRATHEDYEAVIKIDDNVYLGGDYLPSSYHEMIDTPTDYCFIAELDGEVVGISSVH